MSIYLENGNWPPAAHEITFAQIEFFVTLTLTIYARALNLGRWPYDSALGRISAWETAPPYGTASAHLGYLGGLQTSQAAFQRISVSKSMEGCVLLGRKFP